MSSLVQRWYGGSAFYQSPRKDIRPRRVSACGRRKRATSWMQTDPRMQNLCRTCPGIRCATCRQTSNSTKALWSPMTRKANIFRKALISAESVYRGLPCQASLRATCLSCSVVQAFVDNSCIGHKPDGIVSMTEPGHALIRAEIAFTGAEYQTARCRGSQPFAFFFLVASGHALIRLNMLAS